MSFEHLNHIFFDKLSSFSTDINRAGNLSVQLYGLNHIIANEPLKMIEFLALHNCINPPITLSPKSDKTVAIEK
ncbi:hypothetical protein VNO78_07906 [Psophocarpus tetragonolobus]|uniref:Uncharacterized protein n=1 Tax=Psophocarpus tetragonolobus TaxID=3891 RepID=A0AAN9XSH3_PSOTE